MCSKDLFRDYKNDNSRADFYVPNKIPQSPKIDHPRRLIGRCRTTCHLLRQSHIQFITAVVHHTMDMVFGRVEDGVAYLEYSNRNPHFCILVTLGSAL